VTMRWKFNLYRNHAERALYCLSPPPLTPAVILAGAAQPTDRDDGRSRSGAEGRHPTHARIIEGPGALRRPATYQEPISKHASRTVRGACVQNSMWR